MRTAADYSRWSLIIYWVSVMADRIPTIGQDLNANCLKLSKQLTIIVAARRSLHETPPNTLT